MHEVRFRSYHCSMSKNQIMKDINSFAYDPQKSNGYHGNMKFHDDIVCKNMDEARAKLEQLDKGWYDDHAVFYKDGRKKYWLCKIEWHC